MNPTGNVMPTPIKWYCKPHPVVEVGKRWHSADIPIISVDLSGIPKGPEGSKLHISVETTLYHTQGGKVRASFPVDGLDAKGIKIKDRGPPKEERKNFRYITWPDIVVHEAGEYGLLADVTVWDHDDSSGEPLGAGYSMSAPFWVGGDTNYRLSDRSAGQYETPDPFDRHHYDKNWNKSY